MGRFHPDQRYVWVSENDSMKLALGEMWELRQKNLISRVSCRPWCIYASHNARIERPCIHVIDLLNKCGTRAKNLVMILIFTTSLNMKRRGQVILHVFQALVISHRTTAMWTKYTVHNLGKDVPNLLNCLILTINTLPLSSSTPLFIYLPPFLPLPFLPLFFLPYNSLTPSLSFIFSLPPSFSRSLKPCKSRRVTFMAYISFENCVHPRHYLT